MRIPVAMIAMSALCLSNFADAKGPIQDPKSQEFAGLFGCQQSILSLYYFPYHEFGLGYSGSKLVKNLSDDTQTDIIFIPSYEPKGNYGYNKAGERSFFAEPSRYSKGGADHDTKDRYYTAKVGTTQVYLINSARDRLGQPTLQPTATFSGNAGYKALASTKPDDFALTTEIENSVTGLLDGEFCAHYKGELGRVGEGLKGKNREEAEAKIQAKFNSALLSCATISNQKINIATDRTLFACGLKKPGDPAIQQSAISESVGNKNAMPPEQQGKGASPSGPANVPTAK